MRPLRLRHAAPLAVLGALALGGCSTDVAFRTDRRVSFTSPADRSTVTLPLTLTWTVRDFRVERPSAAPPGMDAGYFAVFVDRAPVPPGQPLRYLARDDRRCRPADGCPNAAYLQARGVYTTTVPRLTIEQLPRSLDTTTRERHTAIVVLLDTSGRRIGESAFQLDFDVRRSGT